VLALGNDSVIAQWFVTQRILLLVLEILASTTPSTLGPLKLVSCSMTTVWRGTHAETLPRSPIRPQQSAAFAFYASSFPQGCLPYLTQIVSTILWRLNSKLGLVLFKRLGEEYPDTLGSIIAAEGAIGNVVGMTQMNPPVKDLHEYPNVQSDKVIRLTHSFSSPSSDSHFA
jgi:hypothetical protein